MKTDILVIKYNNPVWEDFCVEAVKYWTVPHHEVILYDNYPKNENIGKLWNQMIYRSRAEYICLLNTDAIVQKDWLTKILTTYQDVSHVGAVGPTTNRSKNEQSTLKKAERDFKYKIMDGYETLSGFCLHFPKHVWQKVNGFPEDFGFYGQEVAFLDRVRNKGYKEIWRQDAFVWHYGSATVKKEQEEGKFNELEERREARKRVKELRQP